jgi:hypothetical protein
VIRLLQPDVDGNNGFVNDHLLAQALGQVDQRGLIKFAVISPACQPG